MMPYHGGAMVETRHKPIRHAVDSPAPIAWRVWPLANVTVLAPGCSQLVIESDQPKRLAQPLLNRAGRHEAA